MGLNTFWKLLLLNSSAWACFICHKDCQLQQRRNHLILFLHSSSFHIQWISAFRVGWDAPSNEISVAPVFGWASTFHHQSTLIYWSVSLHRDLFKEEGARAMDGEGKNKRKSYIRCDYCPYKAYNLFAQSKHEDFGKTARLSIHWVLQTMQEFRKS